MLSRSLTRRQFLVSGLATAPMVIITATGNAWAAPCPPPQRVTPIRMRGDDYARIRNSLNLQYRTGEKWGQFLRHWTGQDYRWDPDRVAATGVAFEAGAAKIHALVQPLPHAHAIGHTAILYLELSPPIARLLPTPHPAAVIVQPPGRSPLPGFVTYRPGERGQPQALCQPPDPEAERRKLQCELALSMMQCCLEELTTAVSEATIREMAILLSKIAETFVRKSSDPTGSWDWLVRQPRDAFDDRSLQPYITERIRDLLRQPPCANCGASALLGLIVSSVCG